MTLNLNANHNIAALRRRSRLKQEAFASLVGTRQFDISRIEKCISEVSPDKLERFYRSVIQNKDNLPSGLLSEWFRPEILRLSPSQFALLMEGNSDQSEYPGPEFVADADAIPGDDQSNAASAAAKPSADGPRGKSDGESADPPSNRPRSSSGIHTPERFVGYYIGLRMSGARQVAYHFEALHVEAAEEGGLMCRLFRPGRKRGVSQFYEGELHGAPLNMLFNYASVGDHHDRGVITFAATMENPCETLFGLSVHVSNSNPPRLISTPALFIREVGDRLAWEDVKLRVASLSDTEMRDYVERLRKEVSSRQDVTHLSPVSP
ncbi:helix-turn-helix domain-containing protein [Azospirillum rugosum]|uniref:HTH cro/C1-type domain-containing protein n=1 Tax=Azospirillum rugosum TaxID=416170 RepID=A0ABS4SF40_9PROT|nr:helix-turn-helix transcriptional regulator [Azospirillum rugosum]MBP2291117.1 hypothetical protein [Azospirillum rugosum]MDQ0524819.1 hypothetical protein [Azospirillum rugosum]